MKRKFLALPRAAYLLFLVAGLLGACASAGNYNRVARKENFHLYLLIGQSNMAGRGKIEPEDTITHARVLMLNKENEWVRARSPLHFDKPIAGTGLGLTFGKIMAAEDKKIVVGLIPGAVGGTAIAKWMPSAYDPPTNTHPYDDAVKRAKLALATGTLKGILWHQGESDASDSLTAQYAQRFGVLLQNLQRDLNTDLSGIPVLAGELGEFYTAINPAGKDINRILQELTQKHKNVELVSTAGLPDGGDQIHFSAAAQRILGQRYAEKMQQWQQRRSP